MVTNEKTQYTLSAERMNEVQQLRKRINAIQNKLNILEAQQLSIDESAIKPDKETLIYQKNKKKLEFLETELNKCRTFLENLER